MQLRIAMLPHMMLVEPLQVCGVPFIKLTRPYSLVRPM